ncbi:MAG: Crp/Fnr family transcriptional regulator [Rhizobacter sp.]|nr:Crp/Fnr family transcriptional regulator [Ferruginibacter sp.]
MNITLRQQIERIVSLSNDEFEWVLSHFTEQYFKKHQIIINEGDYVQNDFYVVKGLIKSSHTNPDGKEHVIQFALEDWWITDPQAFHNQTKATLSVNCLEDSKVLSLTLDNKEKLCRELQKMEYFFLKKTTAGYIALQKRILCLISSTATERYYNLLDQYPGLIQRIPKSMLASYLGVSRETLSRLATI